MARSIAFGIAVLLMLGPAASASRSQDSLLQEMYGQGVHAYFSGKLDQSHELFSAAIDQGSQDPRCYYFRGLSFAKLGRPDEAEADYQRGAELEASGAALQINIGLALQRVQGPQRLQLEEYRYSARLAARLKEAREKKERYEQMQRNEPQVLRGESPAAPAVAPRQPPPPDATDPFAAGAGTPAAPPAAAPAGPAVAPPAGVDLFGMPAAPAAAADPLGASAAPAAADGAGATDPFADPAQPVQMPSEDEVPATDLFGAPAAPAAAEPFGEPAAPAADDVFGQPAMPAAPADADDAQDPLAAPAADPFGAAPPAAPAADDVFGQPAMPAAPADADDAQDPPAAPAADPFGAAPPAPPAAQDPFGAAGKTPPAAATKPPTPPAAEPAATRNDSDILGGADPFGAPPPAAMTEDDDQPATDVKPAAKPAAKPASKPAAADDSDPFADDPA